MNGGLDLSYSKKNSNMKNETRRNFLKQAGLTGLGIIGAGLLKGAEMEAAHVDLSYRPTSKPFNMAGFKAPPLERVRVAVIGLGQRGPSHVRNLIKIEGVEITALCDVVPSKAVSLQKWLVEKGEPSPQLFTQGPEDWKRMLEQDNIDLVVLTTPWYMHAGQAAFAMEAGKHVASEVPAAGTLRECWQLVETAERTRKHMMMRSASYSRMRYWMRARSPIFSAPIVTSLELWATDQPKAWNEVGDGSKEANLKYWTQWPEVGGTDEWKNDWVKILDAEVKLPSGQTDPAALTAEDRDFVAAGFEFEIDPQFANQNFRYIRFVVRQGNWPNQAFFQVSQIKFWGVYAD